MATDLNKHSEETKAISEDDKSTEEAARRIQRAWRASNGPKADFLNGDVRWGDAAVHAKLKVNRIAAEQGKNDPRSRWSRAIFNAGRLRDGDKMLSKSGYSDPGAVHKMLETQHWLELVDGKHRYGSNHDGSKKTLLRISSNDRGGGKDLSLPELPRDRLETERIIYLSSEKRLNYLVEIDKEGKLRWARNHDLVDTTPGHWKDAGDGQGIVPAEGPEVHTLRRQESFGSVSSSEVVPSYDADPPKSKNRVVRMVEKHFTLNGMIRIVAKKTVKRNIWIYVSDKNFNLFIGIKDRGRFQHSSFLAGALATSAGLISVKEGLIHSLDPLSGHYRTTIDHYRGFLKVLKERGVDTHRIEQTKAELALWGIEHLAKMKKKQDQVVATGKGLVGKGRDKTKDASGKVEEGKEDFVRDFRAWKRDVLYGRTLGSESEQGKPQEQTYPQESTGPDHQQSPRLGGEMVEDDVDPNRKVESITKEEEVVETSDQPDATDMDGQPSLQQQEDRDAEQEKPLDSPQESAGIKGRQDPPLESGVEVDQNEEKGGSKTEEEKNEETSGLPEPIGQANLQQANLQQEESEDKGAGTEEGTKQQHM